MLLSVVGRDLDAARHPDTHRMPHSSYLLPTANSAEAEQPGAGGWLPGPYTSHHLPGNSEMRSIRTAYLVIRMAVSCWIPPVLFFCHWQKLLNVVWALKEMGGPS